MAGSDAKIQDFKYRSSTGKVACPEKYMASWEKHHGRWMVIREIYNHDSRVTHLSAHSGRKRRRFTPSAYAQ